MYSVSLLKIMQVKKQNRNMETGPYSKGYQKVQQSKNKYSIEPELANAAK